MAKRGRRSWQKNLDPVEGALLRDVLEHPEDDTPRLILADWWDEHKPECAARAAWVRYSIACPHDAFFNLVRHEDVFPLLGLPPGKPLSLGVKIPGSKREKRTWTWSELTELGFTIHDLGRSTWYTVSRGFIAQVLTHLSPTFKTHATRLFRLHPIERLSFLDRHPDHNRWDSTGAGPAHIPYYIFRHLRGGERSRDRPNSLRYYDSKKLAFADLHQSVLAWGRSLRVAHRQQRERGISRHRKPS